MEVSFTSCSSQTRSVKPADIPSTSRAHSINVTEEAPPTPKEHFHRSESVPKLEDLIAGDSRLEELFKGDPAPSKQKIVEEGSDDDGEEEDGSGVGVDDFTSQIGCGRRGHSLKFLAKPPYSCGAFLCNMCAETGRGRVFHCEMCKFDLCPRCASSSTSSSAGGAAANESPAGMSTSSSSWPNESGSVQETTTSSSAAAQALLGCGNPYHVLEFLPSSPYDSGSYMCNLCWKGGEEEVYHCTSCRDFDLHPHCAKIAREVKSFTHPHGLALQPSYSRGFNAICDGCLKCLGGSQWVYRCSAGCDFDLHALCAKFERRILHPIHADHELVLHNQSLAGPSSYVMCDGCDGAVDAKELIYHCEDCGFDLHPSCAIVPDVVRS